MGRHSRRGPAPKAETTDITAERTGRHGNRADGLPDPAPRPRPGTGEPAGGTPTPGPHDGAPGPGRADGGPVRGAAGRPDGSAGRSTPQFSGGAPARGVPRRPEADSARGGHPEQREAGGGWGEFAGRSGGPVPPGGAAGRGGSRGSDGTPAHGAPGFSGGDPAREGSGAPGAAPKHGVPGAADGGGPGAVLPRQRQAGPDGGSRRGARSASGGPRQEYLEAFDGARPRRARREDTGDVPAGAGSGSARRTAGRPAEPPQGSGAGVPAQRGGARGRAFTGIAAAAVTTVLAVIVAGQVAKTRDDADVRSRSAGHAHGTRASGAPAPAAVPSPAPLTYEQKMSRTYPLGAGLRGPGRFDVVPGFDKAPGTGQKYRYRVDVEQGLGLDGALFAEAVQKTLNDRRSWAHGGARTFERISSGTPDFVITLASPGTTAKWCAKSGLDTTEDNVSCDSAATERVMINAYRWAQGSTTYGDRIHAYRQMLINHEVGHRLGHGHVTCQKDGELAPVMQQQTKFLDHDGIHCRANPWPYPGS
ncbi:DUF3152 domain-containing protein [Streptomyces sp. NPDC006658]|uniref:DUF3152 domain-containing protein n=1 Tax=Streptomyces sp. NPDC006658 TaxID=3156900 RepID=UPI00340B7C4F